MGTLGTRVPVLRSTIETGKPKGGAKKGVVWIV
jgi:hypothetical protein